VLEALRLIHIVWEDVMARSNAWKGCAAGIAGGLAATLVMTGFQSVWNAAMPKANGGGESQQDSESRPLKHNGQNRETRQAEQNPEGENPTAKVADKVMSVAGRELSPEGKQKGGTVVHYAFGTLMGALYGTALEFAPRNYRRNAFGSGLLMGTALFTGADEFALPALGLTGSPTETPVSAHVYGLVSHLVYGATAGLVTRSLRKVM
jgi:uncharacterized membrane protein YagU involved in acid resistance